MRGATWLCLALLALVGCKREDMATQNELRTWDRSTFLPHQSAMQAPVEGTVARDEPDLPVLQPAVITAALLARGQQRYDIFCTPCHGASGDGNGRIVERGFTRPPALYDPRLLHAKAQLFYDVITNGHGVMYSYADRVPPADRWAIAAYIRALQLSQSAQAASLPAADQAKLP
jgi:mono/diheme cytochrome c family protein